MGTIIKTRTGYVVKSETGKKIGGPFKSLANAEKFLSEMDYRARVKKG